MSSEAKCPFNHTVGGGTSNRDWWPNQLRLDILHQHLHEMERAAGSSEGSQEMTAAAGYALARSGNVEGARQRLGELMAHANTRYVSPGLIAQVHAGLGESDAAIACLERAMTARAADLAWLGVRPIFDGLRGDSRVQGMMQRLGLRQT